MTSVTGAPCLLKIGEMISGREYDQNLMLNKTRGGIKELEALDNHLTETLAFLNVSISAVGHLLAYADHKEIEDSLTDIGFLVNGLSALADRLTDEKDHVSYELLMRETLPKQGTKKPAVL